MVLEDKASRTTGVDSSAQGLRDLFVDPRREAVVVYKRRRMPALPAGLDRSGHGQESNDDTTRVPRVFKVAKPHQPGPEVCATPSTAAVSEPVPGSEPSPKRRRRRDAQHAPGKVHHVVFAREAAEAESVPHPASTQMGSPGASSWSELRQGLQAIDRTLQQVREAQRFLAQLEALPFRRTSKSSKPHL